MNITISDIAKEELEKLMTDSEFKSPALRIVFAGAGWGGPRYGLALDESEETKDFTFKENTINLIMDKTVKQYIERGLPISIDYQDSHGGGFLIENGHSC